MPFEGTWWPTPEGKKKSQPPLPTFLETQEKGGHIFSYVKLHDVEDTHHTSAACFPHIDTDDVFNICTIIEIPVLHFSTFVIAFFKDFLFWCGPRFKSSFIYFRPCWISVAVCGLSSSGGEQGLLSSGGFSLWWPVLLHSTDFRGTGFSSHNTWASAVAFPGLWRTSSVPVAFQFSSVTQSCLPLCDPMDCSMPGFPIHHQLPASTQTHVHRVGDAIQPSHPLSSPSPPAPNLSQHHGLFPMSWHFVSGDPSIGASA